MSRPFKIILYVILLTVLVIFGVLSVKGYRAASAKAATTAEKLEDAAATDKVVVQKGPNQSYASMITNALICFGAFTALAFLMARDISGYMAGKAEQALFNDEGAPEDPEYEQAEDLWKDGHYIEAISAMREYLKKNPREQYVALRIAEIYEESLGNHLAAALEYEEVLKKKLPAERWGWAAIHLANLYSGKLNQPDKAMALLKRIDMEYGRTSAANKARERLAQIDPSYVPAATAAEIAEAVAEETTPPPPPSNLPKGFRPK